MALGVAFSSYVWRTVGLGWRKLLPYSIVGISWSTIHNVMSYIVDFDTATNINNYAEVAFGGYVFIFLVVSRSLLFYFQKRSNVFLDLLYGFVHFALLLVPMMEIVYYLNYKASFSTAAAIAVLQSNPGEVKEYFLQNMSLLSGVSISVCILVLVILLFKLNQINHVLCLKEKQLKNGKGLTKKILVASVVLCLSVALYTPKIFMGTSVVHAFDGAKEYLRSAQKFTEYYRNNEQNLNVIKSERHFSKPSTIILIVGESAGRNFMSVYGYSANDTTPWLRTQVESDSKNFLLFNHAYSSYGSTMQALEQAFTEKNQYNNKEFNQSFTIIDLAKKAGYKTYWFSNQSVKNTADTPVQLVARTADVTHWVEDDPSTQNRILYDGDLLPALKMVNPNENNFIVIHVMGSHELTLHRFPPEFTKFSQPGVFDLVPNYEDSMAYSDWVLQQIYDYAKSNLNLQSMIFFSDHGANPYRKRVADNIPFINFRIPLIIYLSDEYQSLYPETTEALRAHKNQYFTNDLLYELVGGVLNITSNHLEQENNFASSEYKYTRDTLKTDLGRKGLNEDISEDKIEK
ncbi:phosphoethanolamine transferase [Veillonella sp. R32]|uniref:phosphoethanolamine transferase n=1 Tax=Veillonella sp. R32 TaxID=2021312 RepID=UPI001EE483F0|nr:phosphoethanolamine transferase [Veillonella sp. R32]